MADDRHIGNYFLYIRNRSSDHDDILHEHADCGRKQCGRLKFAYFKHTRWRTTAVSGNQKLAELKQQISQKIMLLLQHSDFLAM